MRISRAIALIIVDDVYIAVVGLNAVGIADFIPRVEHQRALPRFAVIVREHGHEVVARVPRLRTGLIAGIEVIDHDQPSAL